jgi:NodT family efflux transporter outer membrane factor (OMF) lipoprotein
MASIPINKIQKNNLIRAPRPWRRYIIHLIGAAFSLVLLLIFAGCASVGPSYVKPDAPQADAWQEKDDKNIVSEEDVALDEWWKVFNDPVLDELVETAYRQNLTLHTAAVRIAEARAQLGIAKGGLWPQTQRLDAIYGYNKLSENASNIDPNVIETSYGEWGLGLDVAWELDLWGKYRRAIESGAAGLEAAIANYEDVLVTLTAEVARVYILIRTLEERLLVARENVRIQERSLQITEVRFEGGIVTELDVQQARSLLRSTEALIPQLEAALVRSKNTLSILLGQLPGRIDSVIDSQAPIPTASTQIAVGVPAELLRRRPDIRLAERRLAAQSPRIGIAKADLYPQFALFGSIGFRSQDLSNFISADSIEFFAGPALRWNVLNYNRIRNSVRVQDARFQQLILDYENTVLRAHGEVEDSMASFLRSRERESLLAESVTASKRSVDLSLLQYSEGLVDFQRVLDTQRFLTLQQDQYVSASGSVALSLINMYKALGGGWEIREGEDFIPEDIKQQMSERTKWGKLLEQEELDPQHSP